MAIRKMKIRLIFAFTNKLRSRSLMNPVNYQNISDFFGILTGVTCEAVIIDFELPRVQK